MARVGLDRPKSDYRSASFVLRGRVLFFFWFFFSKESLGGFFFGCKFMKITHSYGSYLLCINLF